MLARTLAVRFSKQPPTEVNSELLTSPGPLPKQPPPEDAASGADGTGWRVE
jgi:hypothetical protein